MKLLVEMAVKTVEGLTLEVFMRFRWIECLHSPNSRIRVSRIPLFVKPLWIFVLLGFASVAGASETILLDPNAPRPPPPTVLSAVVIGEISQATCTIQLMPNGVAVVPAACALADRLRGIAAWQREADQITFRDARRVRLLTFFAAGPNAFRTRTVRPERLRLVFLPQSSVPMSQ